MIEGFIEETKELTAEEISIAKDMASRLSRTIGKNNAVTSTKIISHYKDKQGIKISGARVRKIINFIRVNKLVKNLISTSDGYYVAQTKEEVEKYVLSLNQRIEAITQVRNSFTI